MLMIRADVENQSYFFKHGLVWVLLLCLRDAVWFWHLYRSLVFPSPHPFSRIGTSFFFSCTPLLPSLSPPSPSSTPVVFLLRRLPFPNIFVIFSGCVRFVQMTKTAAPRRNKTFEERELKENGPKAACVHTHAEAGWKCLYAMEWRL